MRIAYAGMQTFPLKQSQTADKTETVSIHQISTFCFCYFSMITILG